MAHSSCKVSDLCSACDKVLCASWPGRTRKWHFLPDPVLASSFGKGCQKASIVFSRTSGVNVPLSEILYSVPVKVSVL